jgi:hypothetical protein
MLRDAAGTWSLMSATGASLEATLADALRLLRERVGADFTFSTRNLADLGTEGVIEDEATLATAVRGASITVLCPEHEPGIGDGTLWASAWRDPTGTISSSGAAARFRIALLHETIGEWFRREDLRSFAPASVMETFSTQPVARPGFHRELLVRNDWAARRLAGDAFPDIAKTAANPKLLEVEKLYQERRQANSEKGKKARTDQIAELDRRMLDPSLTAEERAALAEARKAQFGLPWGTRTDTGSGSGGSPSGR